MKTKLKTNCSIVRMFGMFECGRVVRSILAVALCAVGFAAFAEAPDAVQLWADGPYFATCNVGADTPEGYGILTNFGNAAQAVTDAMGDGWRLPTQGELEKLIDDSYCTRSWDGDRKVLIFTGKGDYAANGICLPAAGYKDDGEFKKLGAYGRYWTSSTHGSYDAYRLHFEGGGSIWVSSDARVYHLSLRAVRDTPPVTVSAVSAEGFLDLTVGDRVVTEDEEPIVVDPAWGKAETATVKLQNGWNRTYTCASNDLWDTTALTPGRHGLALRAGEGETGVLYGAFFWKTGDDWVVLDLPPYSTEGIEFQADKTYLALGQYEFAPDKTLTVLDGAKFEYAPGAGFKGGKLEMPKRYGTNVVEGGLFQIVEKIKGCADNPWVVGTDGETPSPHEVEAYTNGTELVFVGRGTIADLSEIPPAVKTGIKAITVNAGVTDAAAGVFNGFGSEDAKVAVTLPDNWQGELPDEKDTWCGATNVELTSMPMAVRQVKVQQRYPWNGKVDVTFDLTGEGNVKVTLSVRVDGQKLKNPTVDGETTFDLGKGKELKDLRLTWDAAADFGDDEKHEKIKVKLTVSPVEPD